MSVDIENLCLEAHENPSRVGEYPTMRDACERIGVRPLSPSAASRKRLTGELRYFLSAGRAHYKLSDFVAACILPAGALHGQGRGHNNKRLSAEGRSREAVAA